MTTATTTSLRRSERIAGYAFGALFVLLGIAVLATMDAGFPVGPSIAGLVLLVLGGESLWRTAQDRRSLLMRIGPLP